MVEALVHDNLYEADDLDDEYQKRFCRGKYDGYSDGRKYSQIIKAPGKIKNANG